MKKEKALLRLMKNMHLHMNDAFFKWRNYTQIYGMRERLSGEKKKTLLLALQGFCSSNNHALLRLVLERFSLKATLANIQSRFFARLMHTSAGGFLDSFNRWKQLPERKDTE